LPQGFPIPSIPTGAIDDIPVLFATAVAISLVAVGDTISTSGGFASRTGYEVEGNQELIGIGSANVAAGLFSGFPVSTSSSRTAVAFQAGAKTQLTGLVAAGLVLLMLLAVPGLVQAMPQPVLAAVVIAASLSLFDVGELRRLARVRPTEFGLAVTCALGVALIGVLQGIVIAVVLSAIRVFIRAWSPYATILGRPKDVPGWHDIRRYPDAEQVPGLLIVRWSAPLFFANAPLFRDRLRAAIATTTPRPRMILVAAEPITDIDTTAGTMLHDLDLELNEAGIHLGFAELQSSVRDQIVRLGLLEVVDERRLYGSVKEGVDAFLLESTPGVVEASDPAEG
jgi:MFS superfamily sulfate permease-like transporter